MNNKTDLTKTHRAYYSATTAPAMLDLEPINYLAIAGSGDPGKPAFTEAVQALYPVAYAIKFLCKAEGHDFVVPKLEGLWWFDDSYSGISMSEAPRRVPRDAWQWKLLIRMPDPVTKKMVTQAIEQIIGKKDIARVTDVTFLTMHEGKCAQILHVGPFDREIETLQVLQVFLEKQGFKKNGHHHEIYLTDMRKTAPARLRTILREPVA